MKMKKVLLILIILYSTVSYSQYDGIKVPTLKSVHTFEEIDDFHAVYFKLDEQNQLAFKCTGGYELIENLSDTLHSIYLKKAKNNSLGLFAYRPELVIPSDLEMKYVEEIYYEFQKLELHLVLLAAKSESYSKIESIWTTGFYHELDTLNTLILNDDKTYNLKNYVKSEIKKLQNIKAKRANIPPPPPPPFSPLLEDEEFRNKYPFKYSQKFDSLNEALELQSIKINNTGSINLNSENLISITQLEENLNQYVINRKSFFLLEYDQDTKYQDYINILLEINECIFRQRQKYCDDNFLGSYYELSYNDRNTIDYKIPYNLIESYNYYKGKSADNKR